MSDDTKAARTPAARALRQTFHGTDGNDLVAVLEAGDRTVRIDVLNVGRRHAPVSITLPLAEAERLAAILDALSILAHGVSRAPRKPS